MTETTEQRAPAALPAGHDGDFLCYAWGESDRPIASIVQTRDQVIDFLCSQWFGERPETMHKDNREAFDAFMAEFDAPEWDMVDELCWTFEIGGIKVTKIHEDAGSGARALPAHEAKAIDAKLGLEELPPIRLPSEVVAALTAQALQSGRIVQAHVRELLHTAVDLPIEWQGAPRYIAPPIIAALRDCVTELKALNKTIGFRDGEWDSVKIGQEALDAFDAGATESDGVASLRITSWPTGPEYAFEPDRELLELPAGTYRMVALPLTVEGGDRV